MDTGISGGAGASVVSHVTKGFTQDNVFVMTPPQRMVELLVKGHLIKNKSVSRLAAQQVKAHFLCFLSSKHLRLRLVVPGITNCI